MRLCWLAMVALGFPAGVLADPGEISGANVAERFDGVLHVKQRDDGADDQNEGSEEAPLRTIQAAATRAFANRAEGQGTKILIHPGTYRESVQIGSFELDPDASVIIFEATEPGAVVIRGSDVWTDWQREPDTDLFRHDWPHRWGQADIPQGWESVADHLEANPVLLRGEMVFVDGELLRQVMTIEELRQKSGTFFVEEGELDEMPGTLWVHAAEGKDLAANGVEVEVAVRPTIFAAYHMANFVVRGVAFQHASTQIGWPAVRFDGGRNILMEDCRIEWNNWNALSAYVATDVTWRRLTTNHNGAGGMNGWRVSNLRVEDSQASHNNWRGAWGEFLGWAQGQKFLSLRGAHFVNYQAIGNQSVGLWFDWDNEDVLVEGANLSENATRGAFLEASQGPLTLRDCRVVDNGEDGLFITNVARLTLENNHIANNARHQIHCPWLANEHIERRVDNYETGEAMGVRTRDWTLLDNTIIGRGTGLLLALGGWEHFLDSFRADENRYLHADRDEAFGIFRRHGFDYEPLDLDGWRAATGQDQDSTFSRQAP